jgi:hypothetical protein
MDSPMATRPPPNDRSAREDSSGGAFFPFQSLEVHVLDFKAYSGVGAREQNFRSSHRSVVMRATSNGGFSTAIK